MLIWVNCISLCIMALGTYVIWWDRKNVFNHFFIGFCIIGYIIPTAVFNFTDYADSSIIELYVAINCLGTIMYVIGLLIGYRIKAIPIVNTVMKFSIPKNATVTTIFQNDVLKVIKKIYLVSLITMAVCFLFMGYLPMFADDPYSAKQFKGTYQASYQRVAYFYRTSKQFIELLMPFLIIELYFKRKVLTSVLIVLGLLLILVTLNRSAMFKGILWVIAILVALSKSKKFFTLYLLGLVIIFSIGSSFWAIISYLFPGSAFTSWSEGQTVAQSIAYGAPDIPDQLQLLNAFVKNKVDYTYGLTYVGGLIPFNFKWNPSVWTLSVVNQTDNISEIVSGGLRLPMSLWGYVSFGWFGVFLLPFLAGFFQGYIVRKIKRIINLLKPDFNGALIFYYIVFLYLNIGVLFFDFYELSIYYLPAIIFFKILIYYNNKKRASYLKTI